MAMLNELVSYHAQCQLREFSSAEVEIKHKPVHACGFLYNVFRDYHETSYIAVNQYVSFRNANVVTSRTRNATWILPTVYWNKLIVAFHQMTPLRV